MNTYVLRAKQWIPRPTREVFSFFADASNLEAITPPWLHFKILPQGPIEMKVGTLIDYRLRLHGVPLRWQTEITVWDPPYRFVDQQRRGPYLLWIHEHTFVESNGCTLAVDRVKYEVPGGALIHKLIVAPDLRKIFEYRCWRLQEIFGRAGPPAARGFGGVISGSGSPTPSRKHDDRCERDICGMRGS